MIKKKKSRSATILIANGVNLDLLGHRETEHYGDFSLLDLERYVRQESPKIGHAAGFDDVDVHFFQTNDETLFLQKLTEGWDGAVVNAGAWTHSSIALSDRLVALDLTFIEVHISNIAKREAFRQKSFLAPHANGVISGLGMDSYAAGLYALLRCIS